MSPGSPSIGQNPIVGWPSPLTGTITVNATVRANETWCAVEHNGLTWSIDQGASTRRSGRLVVGETATITLSTSLSTGEARYLIIDADGNSSCDGTSSTW